MFYGDVLLGWTGLITQLIYKVEPTLTFITHLWTFVTPRLEESLVRALPPKLSYSLTTIAEGTSSVWEPGTTMKWAGRNAMQQTQKK